MFYPEGLAQRRELEYLSRRVDSVEINGSFYALQKPESYQRWREETPEGFVFSVKGPRFVTHMKRLKDAEAVEVGRGHDERMKGREWLRTDQDRPIRYAIEVRNPDFGAQGFIDLLRDKGIALVVADTAGKWPYFEQVTADFVYARLHGDKELYASGYSDEALDRWAAKVRDWRERGDVFVYFYNDVKVKAPGDAQGLARRL
ncbi:uncharacterized protein YecE (DUF72 family) [Actinokineospora baliensis]|nr:DUF72 domain-containing protein [Actinokineospora baliensis]MBM7776281.1 uncharacterized protein YecE (DUF72 family) [Actinokineospora baliensis]